MYYLLNLIKNFWILILLWFILLVIDTGLLVNYILLMYNIVVTPLIFLYLKAIFFNQGLLFCLFLYFLLSLYSIKLPGYKYINFFGYDGKILKDKYWENIKLVTNKNMEISVIFILLLYFLLVFFFKIYKEFWIFTIIISCFIISIFIKKKTKTWVLGLFSKKKKFFFLIILLFITFKISTLELCSDLLHNPIYFDKIGFNIASAKIDEYKQLPNVEMNAKLMGEDLNWVKKREEDNLYIFDMIWWEKIKVIYFFDAPDYNLLVEDIYKWLTQNWFLNIKDQFNVIMSFIIECKNLINSSIFSMENSIEEIEDENNEIFIEKNLEGGVYVRDYLVGDSFFVFNRYNYYKHNFLLENLYLLDLYMLNHSEFEDKLKGDWIKNLLNIRDEAKDMYEPSNISDSWNDFAIYVNKYIKLLDQNNLFWIFDWVFDFKNLLKSTLTYNMELHKDDDDPIYYWGGDIPFLLGVTKQDMLNDLNFNVLEEGDYITWSSSGLFSERNDKCEYFLNADIQDWNDNLIDIFVRKYYGYEVSKEENELYQSEFVGLQKPKVYNRKETELWWLKKQKGGDTQQDD